jgi:hypothetical protein
VLFFDFIKSSWRDSICRSRFWLTTHPFNSFQQILCFIYTRIFRCYAFFFSLNNRSNFLCIGIIFRCPVRWFRYTRVLEETVVRHHKQRNIFFGKIANQIISKSKWFVGSSKSINQDGWSKWWQSLFFCPPERFFFFHLNEIFQLQFEQNLLIAFQNPSIMLIHSVKSFWYASSSSDFLMLFVRFITF